jgi:hypothetical protein
MYAGNDFERKLFPSKKPLKKVGNNPSGPASGNRY